MPKVFFDHFRWKHKVAEVLPNFVAMRGKPDTVVSGNVLGR